MLPRSRRLRRGDFPRVYRSGRRVRLPSITVWWAPGLACETVVRFGVVVSSRIAKRAVERNRYRRRLAACLASAKSPSVAYHVVVSANPSITARSYAELKVELTQLLTHFPPQARR